MTNQILDKLLALLERIKNKALFELGSRIGKDFDTGITYARHPNLIRLGGRYAGWIIPGNVITSGSICYCAGVGEDISFDRALIDRFGCHVLAFDPTPRAIAYVQKQGPIANFTLNPCGLWDKDETLKFYAPADPNHVSHSAINLQHTDTYFEAPVRRTASIMREFGHAHIDLLKLDIEGAEYKVLNSILEDKINIKVLCVEYDEGYAPLDNSYIDRIRESLIALQNGGFALVAMSARFNYTFVTKS